MVFYGLSGITHGGARVLTVMSPDGSTAVIDVIDAGHDVHRHGGAGRLIQYHEKRSGALRRLIQTYDIVLLSKSEWDSKKAELGPAVLR